MISVNMPAEEDCNFITVSVNSNSCDEQDGSTEKAM